MTEYPNEINETPASLENVRDQHPEVVDLVDAWIAVVKFKNVFIAVAMFFMTIGVVYTFFIYSETYSLVTTIQIGSREINDVITPLQTPESLLSKINNSIVPSYTNQWITEHQYEGSITTTSSNPVNSNIVLIKNNVREDEIDLISNYQKGLVSIVKDDDKRMIKALKSAVLTELGLAKLELEKLQNPVTLEHMLKVGQIRYDEEATKLSKLEDKQYVDINKAEFQNQILQEEHELNRLGDLEKVNLKHIERIAENKKILLQSINELKAQIADSAANLRAATASATELSAMSQLLIGTEIQKSQDRLRLLEERYYVELENEKTDYLQKNEALRLKKIEAKKSIELLNEKYKRMLADNAFMRDQQKNAVEKAKMELDQIKLQYTKDVKTQEERVREINTRIDNFNETRIVSAAVPSLKPSGISQIQLFLLTIIGAIFAGFFAVLVSLFRDKVKQRMEMR